MTDAVKNTIQAHGLFARGDSVLVGVSGGADSVALLHALVALKDELGLAQLRACHFNHGLRGAESDGDEAYVRALCARLDVALTCARGEMSAREKPQGESVESWARSLRYAFFEQTAREGELVALAHNKNDCVETTLFHLARGTGLKGLRGMPVRRGRYVRPLLETTREQIELYCAEHGLDYRTDLTNADVSYARNRIRKNILPELEMINAGVVNNICRLSAQAGEASDYFERAAGRLLESAADLDGWSAEQLCAADPLIVRFALKQILESVILDVSEDTVIRAQAVLCGAARRCELTSGVFFARRGDTVAIDRETGDTPPDVTETAEITIGVTTLSCGISVNAAAQTGCEGCDEKFTKKDLNNSLDCDKIIGKMILRTRREGDTFTQNGRGVTKSVKKLFNEAKIPPDSRALIPVVCDGAGIVWMRGFGVCARVACDRETKNSITLS